MATLTKFESEYLNVDLDLRYDKKALLTIPFQSPKVEKFFSFLDRMGKDHYLTKSGIRIAMSAFPEWKDSLNTIYLQGSWSHRDGITDTTRFVNNSTYRKNKVKLFESALKEFVSELRKVDNAGLLDTSRMGYVFNSNTQTSNIKNFLAKANKIVRCNTARENSPVVYNSPISVWLSNGIPTYRGGTCFTPSYTDCDTIVINI